jgi:hypothetical protein
MKQTGLSPFEVLYGLPHLLIKGIQEDIKETGDLTLRQQMHICFIPTYPSSRILVRGPKLSQCWGPH